MAITYEEYKVYLEIMAMPELPAFDDLNLDINDLKEILGQFEEVIKLMELEKKTNEVLYNGVSPVAHLRSLLSSGHHYFIIFSLIDVLLKRITLNEVSNITSGKLLAQYLHTYVIAQIQLVYEQKLLLVKKCIPELDSK